MKKVLIATHGKLANGFKSALEFLYAEENSVEVLNAYVNEVNEKEKIESFINEIGEEDVGIIFTDIKCGSVNQLVMNLLAYSNKNIYVLTGVNLPLILEIMLSEEDITDEYLNQVVELAKNELSLVNLKIENGNSEEDLFS